MTAKLPLLIVMLLAAAACTRDPRLDTHSDQNDSNAFQDITGTNSQNAQTEKLWDRVFLDSHYEKPRDPTPFLVEWLPNLPRGDALVLAMGEGRNAIYLARNGYRVDGVDISSVAVNLARTFAYQNQVKLNAIQADLRTYQLRKENYDVIVEVTYFDRKLIPAIKAALKPGGVFICQLFLKEHLDLPSASGTSPDFLVERGELAKLFSDFEILQIKETVELTGKQPGAFARLVARKKSK